MTATQNNVSFDCPQLAAYLSSAPPRYVTSAGVHAEHRLESVAVISGCMRDPVKSKVGAG